MIKGFEKDWNEDGAVLSIRVVPPFWKTWFFQRAVLLLALLGATAAVLKRTSSIRARSRELEEKIDERTAELQKRQKHIETILSNAPNAIVDGDSRFRVIEWSPGAERMSEKTLLRRWATRCGPWNSISCMRPKTTTGYPGFGGLLTIGEIAMGDFIQPFPSLEDGA